MTTPDKTLLILGIVLFAVLVLGLVVLLVKGGKPTPLLPFFIVPIAMIAFSEIKAWKGPWGEIDMKVASDYSSHPDDPRAIRAYRATLTKLDDERTANPGRPLPTQTTASLESTVKALSIRSNLPPDSQAALAHAQFLLGHTNAAAVRLNAAVRTDTNLLHTIDPRMKILVRPISH